MKLKVRNSCYLASAFMLSLAPTLLAENVHVGGPPRVGHGRAPLQVNLTPAASAQYFPAQLRHAYGFAQLAATGANHQIALVHAYGADNVENDHNIFLSQFGVCSAIV